MLFVSQFNTHQLAVHITSLNESEDFLHIFKLTFDTVSTVYDLEIARNIELLDERASQLFQLRLFHLTSNRIWKSARTRAVGHSSAFSRRRRRQGRCSSFGRHREGLFSHISPTHTYTHSHCHTRNNMYLVLHFIAPRYWGNPDNWFPCEIERHTRRQLEDYVRHMTLGVFNIFRPKLCNTPFASRHLRLEFDTRLVRHFVCLSWRVPLFATSSP